ncbi:Achilleol B synthase [Zea mays]|uniref:Achilleol B synthase n=1 Tax=Zea mays TaxID=4577 RepID=A0A317Y464_MAIZE|nr:Achilleol B synthase [Zea mays]
MRMQFTGQKHLHADDMPAAFAKIEEGDEVTEERLRESLKRAMDWMSELQAEDGHWPGDFSGIMYMMPFWIFALHITGTVDAVLSKEHRREICRHIYNHQVIGVYDWRGNNPVVPELWLIPRFLPIHPGIFLLPPSASLKA